MHLIFFMLLFAFCDNVESWNITYEMADELHNRLLENYTKHLRPVKYQIEPVHVTVSWKLHSINDFHEVSGDLVTTSTFIITWTNELLQWNLYTYKLFYSTFSATQVWNPVLVLHNPTGNSNIRKIAMEGIIRGTPSGMQYFMATVMTSTTCQPDMSLYPFDRHNCSIKLSSAEYLYKELVITPINSNNISTLDDISQWDVIGFYTYNSTSVYTSVVTFGIIFQRKPGFIILNLLTPIVLLCFLNLAVYILPPQSGERVSFSVTMFLSFSVYMTLISEKLPVTNPVSIFTHYLIFNVGYSALILFTTVVGLRFHMAEKDERIPLWLAKIACICSNVANKKTKHAKIYEITHTPSKSDEVLNTDNSHIDALKKMDMESDAPVVTKRDFGQFVDRVFFGLFFLMLVIANVIYIVYITSS